MECRITLEKSWFTPKETEILRAGEFTASAFMYSTGVAAVRLKNTRGEIIMLPYQGQQIWSAVFDGRPLHMSSLFEEPRPAESIMDTYGALLFHCGALRMGDPLPGDTHQVHGELPCARYASAALVAGGDGDDAYIGLTGAFNYRKGFEDFYDAVPTVLLRAGKSILDVSMRVHNIGCCPMDLMYMPHLNYRMGDDARIVQTGGWTPGDMILRDGVPAPDKSTPEYLAFIDRLRADPKITEVLRREDSYNPGIILFLRNMKAGKDGLAHVLQIHADGGADTVSWDPRSLNRHVRWMLRNGNQSAIGILPSTAEPEGYAAEKRKGNVRSLGPGETAVFSVQAGSLSKAEAAEALKLI
jgi:hypothetical protein